MGKIQLLKFFIYSKLIFIASLNPIPHSVFQELDKMTFDFLWRGKDKVKRTTMFLDYKNGGLKMMNFELFIKVQRIMWVKRLLIGNQQMKWKLYFDYCTQHIGGKFIFFCKYDIGQLKLSLSPFYLELLETWLESEDLRQICSNYKGNEVIFNNKYICFRGFPFYHANLISKGIFRLKHIVDKDGELKTDAYFTSKGLTSWNILQIKHIFEKIPPSWKRQMHLTEEKKKDIDMEEILFIVSDKIVHVSELV